MARRARMAGLAGTWIHAPPVLLFDGRPTRCTLINMDSLRSYRAQVVQHRVLICPTNRVESSSHPIEKRAQLVFVGIVPLSTAYFMISLLRYALTFSGFSRSHLRRFSRRLSGFLYGIACSSGIRLHTEQLLFWLSGPPQVPHSPRANDPRTSQCCQLPTPLHA